MADPRSRNYLLSFPFPFLRAFLPLSVGISIHGGGKGEVVVTRCVGKKVTEFFFPFFFFFFSFIFRVGGIPGRKFPPLSSVWKEGKKYANCLSLDAGNGMVFLQVKL